MFYNPIEYSHVYRILKLVFLWSEKFIRNCILFNVTLLEIYYKEKKHIQHFQ